MGWGSYPSVKRLHGGVVTTSVRERRVSIQHHHGHWVTVGVGSSHLQCVSHHPHVVRGRDATTNVPLWQLIEVIILILIVVVLNLGISICA